MTVAPLPAARRGLRPALRDLVDVRVRKEVEPVALFRGVVDAAEELEQFVVDRRVSSAALRAAAGRGGGRPARRGPGGRDREPTGATARRATDRRRRRHQRQRGADGDQARTARARRARHVPTGPSPAGRIRFRERPFVELDVGLAGQPERIVVGQQLEVLEEGAPSPFSATDGASAPGRPVNSTTASTATAASAPAGTKALRAPNRRASGERERAACASSAAWRAWFRRERTRPSRRAVLSSSSAWVRVSNSLRAPYDSSCDGRAPGDAPGDPGPLDRLFMSRSPRAGRAASAARGNSGLDAAFAAAHRGGGPRDVEAFEVAHQEACCCAPATRRWPARAHRSPRRARAGAAGRVGARRPGRSGPSPRRPRRRCPAAERQPGHHATAHRAPALHVADLVVEDAIEERLPLFARDARA